MGCGAVCGASSSVVEGSKQAQIQFKALFKQITANQFLYPIKSIVKFTKDMQLYPQRLQIILTQKLQAKNFISIGVMQKWKIILFGLDCNRQAYVNCLGYPKIANKIKLNLDKQTSQQHSLQKQAAGEATKQNNQLIQHKVFSQIEKDIERTFPGYQFQKNSFTLILKRISNQFPIMGYTQGINFIVGYLLIIGYSQFDAYWLFVHIAISRRYLMLGLYEDGFPLINVYTSIFRTMLKRINQKLYIHLYENVVMFQQSAWVFKWFMTCYLSSFPIQMCQFVWDMVFSIGAIALVKFAISMVLKLQPFLLQSDDACDISQFFASLKNIQTFNRYLSIREIVKDAYKLKIQICDLSQLKQVKTQCGDKNFYAQYIVMKFQEQFQQQNKFKNTLKNQITKLPLESLNQTDSILFPKNTNNKSSALLNQWYQKLTKQRIEFCQRALASKKPLLQFSKPQSLIQLQNSRQISKQPSKKLNNLDLQTPQLHRQAKTSIQKFASLDGVSVDGSYQRRQNSKTIQNFSNQIQVGINGKGDSVQVSPSSKIKNMPSSRYNIKRTKKEQTLWKQDDELQQIQENKDKIVIEDQFMYIARDIRFKRKNVTYQDDILSQFSNVSKPKQINNNYIPKTAQLKPETHIDSYTAENNSNIAQSRLAKVGNAVLSNMSASNASNKSSNSSYKTIQKQNNMNKRYCKCNKNKTQNGDVELVTHVPLTRKKIQKLNQHQQTVEYEKSVDLGNPRKRNNTYHDWMINSQGPRVAKNLGSSNVKQPSQLGSEVQIMHGRQMFKKKGRAEKIGGGIGIIIAESRHITEKQVSQCQSQHVPTPAFGQQQQSCESSFFVGQVSSHRSQAGDVQSAK